MNIVCSIQQNIVVDPPSQGVLACVHVYMHMCCTVSSYQSSHLVLCPVDLGKGDAEDKTSVHQEEVKLVLPQD